MCELHAPVRRSRRNGIIPPPSYCASKCFIDSDDEIYQRAMTNGSAARLELYPPRGETLQRRRGEEEEEEEEEGEEKDH